MSDRGVSLVVKIVFRVMFLLCLVFLCCGEFSIGFLFWFMFLKKGKKKKFLRVEVFFIWGVGFFRGW